MPRTPLQFQQMKDERKLSFLESALPLFAVHGKDISMDLICQKAKCSHGLAYHYFKNTEQIYNELLTSETYKDLLNKLSNVDVSTNAYAQIENKVRILLSLVNESKALVSFALIIISQEDKKSFFITFSKLVAQGQKEGTVTGGNPSDIVSTFFLLLKDDTHKIY